MLALESSSLPTAEHVLRCDGSIVVMPRTLQGGVVAALDALPPKSLPRLHFVGALADLRSHLRRAVKERIDKPRWFVQWIVDDVFDRAALLVAMTGAPAINLRLDVVEDDRCRLFHVDKLRVRLITTYRGPGTEWVPPQIVATLAPGATPPSDAVRHLARGEVAVMRGSEGATPGRPAVLHRSPSIEGTGLTRLLLTIDEQGRQLH